MSNERFGNGQGDGLCLTCCSTSLNEHPHVVLVESLRRSECPNSALAVVNTSKRLAERLSIHQNLSGAFNNERPGGGFLPLPNSNSSPKLVDWDWARHVQEGVDVSCEVLQRNLHLGRPEGRLDEVEALGHPDDLCVVGRLDGLAHLRSHLLKLCPGDQRGLVR